MVGSYASIWHLRYSQIKNHHKVDFVRSGHILLYSYHMHNTMYIRECSRTLYVGMPQKRNGWLPFVPKVCTFMLSWHFVSQQN